MTSHQPAASVTHDDVERIVRRDFAPNDVADALAIVAGYGAESHERETDRVRAAALKQARGDLDRLRQQVSLAKMDYRDVLAAAEYPEATRVWLAMDRMTDAERQAIYGADRRQYDAWFTRA
jgi:hypothetical protein